MVDLVLKVEDVIKITLLCEFCSIIVDSVSFVHCGLYWRYICIHSIILEPVGSEEGKLIEKEEMERGSVSYRVYMYYLRAITFPVAFIVTFFILSQSGIRIGTNFWLSNWSNANANLAPNVSIVA